MSPSDIVAGFDYGTSHCAIGLKRGSDIELTVLEDNEPLIGSTLYAPKADFELEMGDDAVLDMTSQSFQDLKFGAAALEAYLREPTQGYFVKSPKSFLGAPGLSERVKERFISIVAAMMANVKRHADRQAATGRLPTYFAHQIKETSQDILGKDKPDSYSLGRAYRLSNWQSYSRRNEPDCRRAQ